MVSCGSRLHGAGFRYSLAASYRQFLWHGPDPETSVRSSIGRKADIQTDRPRLSLEEIRTLFRKVRSNGVEPIRLGVAVAPRPQSQLLSLLD